jgi:hypothetical protein
VIYYFTDKGGAKRKKKKRNDRGKGPNPILEHDWVTSGLEMPDDHILSNFLVYYLKPDSAADLQASASLLY